MILAINNILPENAALLPTRTLNGYRKETAKRCLEDIVSIRAIRLDRERLALEAQAALMGITQEVKVKSGTAIHPDSTGLTEDEVNTLRDIIARAKGGDTFSPVAVVPEQAVVVVDSLATLKDFTIKDAFKVKMPPKLALTIENHQPNHPMVPKANPEYVFREREIFNFIGFLQMKERFLFMSGPTGCGKSSLFIEAAAVLGIPLFELTGHDRTETPELFGCYKLNSQGGMDWVDGPLIRAIKANGWFLLNEIDQMHPSTLVGLNGVTETSQRSILIPETGEMVMIGDNFRFIATGNSNGCGDSTGLYQGVNRLSIAFMDRPMKQTMDYPDTKTEMDILQKTVPTIALIIVAKMVEYANDVRSQFIKGEIEVTFSTRTLLRWARSVVQFTAMSKGAKNAPSAIPMALEMALSNMAEPDTRSCLFEMCQRHFGGDI